MSHVPSNDSSVLVSREDLIDAMGALELRIEDLRHWSRIWEQEHDAERAKDRRERAEHLTGVLERLREAMKR